MKLSKKIIQRGLIVLGVLALAGFAAVFYMFNMPHRDIQSERATFSLSASELIGEFFDDQAAGNAKYLDQVIEVTGQVAEIRKDMNGQTVVLLMETGEAAGVRCSFTEETSVHADALNIGERVRIKGIVRAGAFHHPELNLVEHAILEKSNVIH